jgi:ribonuclease R
MALPIDRDSILAAFEQDPDRPLKVREVGRFIGVSADDRKELRAMMRVLTEEGDLEVLPGKRYVVAGQGEMAEGLVTLNGRGLGFVILGDKNTPDAFIPPPELPGLMAGDKVRIRVAPSPKGPVAQKIQVVTRARPKVTGTLVRQRRGLWVECPPEVLGSPLIIPPGTEGGAEGIEDGTVVEVFIEQYPTHITSGVGRVVRVIGKSGDISVEVDRLLADSGIPRHFSPETLAAASSLGAVPSQEDMAGREDLRAVPLCTIDGATAKDFDDAVYGRREGKDFVVTVAIADVSHYVKEGEPLDVDARARGTSVYYPGAVVPMLPEALSNGLCSLNPHVDRLCMCVEMTISPQGKAKKARFFEGVMKSHARLTYMQVAGYFEGEPLANASAKVKKSIDVLRDVAAALRKARLARGAMDFDLPEGVVKTDDDGMPLSIRPLARNDAHKLIEELMLAANEAVASRFEQRGLPSIYRIHEPPNEQKVKRFLTLAKILSKEQGVAPPRESGKQAVPSARDIRGILEPLKASPLKQALDFLLLRAMMQAKYSAENVGHYSLSSDAYTHFTSPIRRYPDLVVHRLLRDHIRHPRKKLDDVAAEDRFEVLDATGATCSEQERRATDVERQIQALCGVWLLRHRVGQEFQGAVSGCAEFGIFVRLDDPYVEGMVHVSGLGDFMNYDELRLRLFGGRSGFDVGVGDVVKVRVQNVDVHNRKVELELLHISEQHGEACDRTPPAPSPRSQRDERGDRRPPPRGGRGARDDGGRESDKPRGRGRGPQKKGKKKGGGGRKGQRGRR